MIKFINKNLVLRVMMMINEELADRLVHDMSIHLGLEGIDRELFSKSLTAAKLSLPFRFGEYVRKTRQIVPEIDHYHYISVTRLLRNDLAKTSGISLLIDGIDRISYSLGICSSGILTRRLTKDEEITEMMSKSDSPYSLFGKIQKSEYSIHELASNAPTAPFLVIPGYVNNSAVKRWEKENTIPFTDAGFSLMMNGQK